MGSRKELLSQDVIQAVRIALEQGTFDAKHLTRYIEQLVNDRQNRTVTFLINPDDPIGASITIGYDMKDPDVASK